MTIELNINNKKHIFASSIITGYMFRRALQLKEKQDTSAIDTSLLDEIGQFVCEVFHDQFTLQQLYEGLEVSEVFETFNNVVRKVLYATLTYKKH